MIVLPAPEWQMRRQAHVERVSAWTHPHLERRRHGRKHPVIDFLFDYYHVRPAVLARWHPGLGVALADASNETSFDHDYETTDFGTTLAPAAVSRLLPAIAGPLRLLQSSGARTPRYDCFALHEWAMVYRPEERRHDRPLRVDAATLHRTIAEVGLRCSHVDAFRFFAPEAVPLNEFQPTRATQVDLDQPGCIHVNMDLFKWAHRLVLIVGSDLAADCFAMALRLRELDMRAAPYDLRDLGVEPIKIETAQGRAEFALLQRQATTDTSRLRQRLIEALRAVHTSAA